MQMHHQPLRAGSRRRRLWSKRTGTTPTTGQATGDLDLARAYQSFALVMSSRVGT